MDGLGFVVRNRENGLRDHALENGLRQRKALVAGHISQSRILVGLAGHQVEYRTAALDGGHQLVISLKVDYVLRQLAHDFAEQTGIQYDSAGFYHIDLSGRANAHGQVVAGDSQSICIGCQQQTFEQRHRAFAGYCAGGDVEQIQQGFLFTGKLHSCSSQNWK